MRHAYALALLLAIVPFAQAEVSDAHASKAGVAAKKAVEYLRSQQQPDGSWSKRAAPAVTALVVAALLEEPSVKRDDPMVAKAIDFILASAKADGSIHDGVLETYSTSICLTALAKAGNDPKVVNAVKKGREYLKQSQWTHQTDPDGKKVDKDHLFYGGTGYGKGGRPDASNTHFVVEAFIETGSDCKDPEIVAAVAFFSRLQGIKSNKALGDRIQQNGGAIYAPSEGKGPKAGPKSAAGEIVEDGRSVLRTYGSMTYAMFKTYVYAQLEKDDPRVVEAKKWISSHYSVDVNPGMPKDKELSGYFYYMLTFSRALSANKEPIIATADGKKHNWAQDVIDKLSTIQKPDGSWVNDFDRYMEGEPSMVTAMALSALQAARR